MQAEPKGGLCQSCGPLFEEDHRIICHVFMDIGVRSPLRHILWQRSSPHCPNSILWTGEPSHVMFLPRSRSSGTEKCVAFFLHCPLLPLSYKHLSLCMVLAAMCFSQHLARRRERGGERQRKGGLFKQGMTDALLKEAGPFERLAPPCSPHPHVSGPLSRGGGSNPPARRFVTVSHLTD